MKRFCMALDLKDDQSVIREYERYHKQENVWPEISQSIKDSGIRDMQIYRVGNRLFMIMEVEDDFDFEQKTRKDLSNPKVVEWEKLMWQFQKPLPWAKKGQKWVKMKRIFKL